MITLFSLKNVDYCHGQRFKLNVPQLHLMPKDVHIIAGPGGSGKSTLLQLLALLKKPTRGEVWFKGDNLRGYDYEQLSVLRLQLTMVGQSPCLFSGKVYDNLAYGLQIRGIYGSEQEQRINNAIRTFGLCGYEHRNVQELSRGEVQRVAIARALVLEPEVLLLDEPTADIDPKSRIEIEAGISALPQQGITVIMTTDNDHPKRFGGTFILLSNGRLAA